MQAIVAASDPDERDVYAFMLRRAGLAVASSADIQRILAKWTDHPADLVLVALGEGAAPLKVVEAVRDVTQAPVIVVVDPPPEKTLCRLLLGGADVVLPRPVSPLVLVAHAQALLRRSNAVPAFVLPTLDLEKIALDPSTRTVTVDGQEPQRLTQLEFRLLYVLMTNRGQVIPVDAIVERVWGYTGEGNRDLVRGLISRLRHKIEPDPQNPRLLETISGIGYRFALDEI